MAELAPKTTLSTRQHIEMEASIHWLLVVAVIVRDNELRLQLRLAGGTRKRIVPRMQRRSSLQIFHDILCSATLCLRGVAVKTHQPTHEY